MIHGHEEAALKIFSELAGSSNIDHQQRIQMAFIANNDKTCQPNVWVWNGVIRPFIWVADVPTQQHFLSRLLVSGPTADGVIMTTKREVRFEIR